MTQSEQTILLRLNAARLGANGHEPVKTQSEEKFKCRRITIMAKAKVKRINHKEMLEKIREYKELKGTIDDLKQQQDDVKNDIIKVMTDYELDTYKVDVFTVTYKDVTTTGIDSKRLEAERPDLYGKYLKETTSKRFRIA